MAKEATVYMLEDEKSKRRTGRKPRVSPVISSAVALLKQAQAKALEAGLATQDGAKAELFRMYAQAMDDAARYVLFAFDELSRKPQL